MSFLDGDTGGVRKSVSFLEGATGRCVFGCCLFVVARGCDCAHFGRVGPRRVLFMCLLCSWLGGREVAQTSRCPLGNGALLV